MYIVNYKGLIYNRKNNICYEREREQENFKYKDDIDFCIF